MKVRRGYTSDDRKKVRQKMEENRQRMEAKMNDGYLSEEEEDQIREDTQEQQDVLSWRYKKENRYDPKKQYVPDAEMIEMLKKSEVPNAAKLDSKYFGDLEFHGDEQKEKTQELLEKEEGEIMFLEDPEDPGYWPPILYSWDKEKWGPKTPYYMHEREDKNATKEQKDSKKKERESQELQRQASGNPCTWDGGPDSKDRFYIFPLTWDQIGTDWTIVVLGKRRSGKTVFIKSLCGNYLRPFFPRVYVFTKSFYSGEYTEFVPEAHIFPGLTPDETDKKTGKFNEGGITALARIFATQKKYKEASKKGSFHGNMNCLIIIDDCLSDGFRYQKLIDEVFFEGRHMNICFVVTSQDFKGVNPACTGNADMCVQFRCRSERDKEAVRTKFCDFFKNDEEFEALTGQGLSKKWHSVAYMQDKPHIDPRFTIYCGRPVPPAPFVMGCKRWWKENQKQLLTIIKQYPELSYLLQTDDWGIMGEEEMNEEMKHIPQG